MLKVEDMTLEEIKALLASARYGHLGVAREGRPYVVPMNYVYDAQDIYFFTTEGMKTEFLAANSQVCLQVEEVEDAKHWRSVIVNGEARQLTSPDELEHAMQLITRGNPTLTPAINATQIDDWGRPNVTAIYRIHPVSMDGRKTVSDTNTGS
ncbi:MAG TPA: pyridoxamine 5'-phosphate oxidase family protein [Pyrinomonadaceae bacterium]|jgi:hypothetical protein